MIANPAPPALYFPAEILKTDEDLARRFASADATFEDIVASADESGDKTLLALAATAVSRRKEGLRNWREKQVARLLEIRSKDLREYIAAMEGPQWEKIKTGECPLIDLEQGVSRFMDETLRENSRVYAESKKALKSVLQEAVHDPDENASPFELPQSLYVSEDGDVKLFRKAKNAKQYGKDRGVFHVVVQIAAGTARFRRGAGT